jgi:hypothetical protein
MIKNLCLFFSKVGADLGNVRVGQILEFVKSIVAIGAMLRSFSCRPGGLKKEATMTRWS